MVISGTFEQVLTYMGFALGIFPIMTVFSLFKLRRRNPESVRMPGYPVTQVIYILTGFLILVLSYLERPMESSVAALTVLAGIPAYFIFKSRNSALK
jgi:APA family basic amino acid/polyamine antiporter